METTRTREEMQKRELAEAFRRLNECEDLMERMLADLEEQISEFGRSWQGKVVRVSELMNYSGYTESMAADIRNQQARIEAQAEEVRRHREYLIELSRDKKVLEKLKDKRYSEFKKKLRTMEQKFMDELSVRSFHNGNGKGIMQ